MLVILLILVVAYFKKKYKTEIIFVASIIYAVCISVLQIAGSGRTEIYYEKDQIKVERGVVILQDSIKVTGKDYINEGLRTHAKITRIDFMFESNWIYYPFFSFNDCIISGKVELSKEDYEKFSHK